MLVNILSVAAGGAIGAVLRYLLGLIPLKADFPVITLIINFGGAFMIGFFTALAEKNDFVRSHRPFLTIGLCGGFSTFAAFSLETLKMLQDGRLVAAFGYAGLSVILCVVGAFVGIMAGTAVTK